VCSLSLPALVWLVYKQIKSTYTHMTVPEITGYGAAERTVDVPLVRSLAEKALRAAIVGPAYVAYAVAVVLQHVRTPHIEANNNPTRYN